MSGQLLWYRQPRIRWATVALVAVTVGLVGIWRLPATAHTGTAHPAPTAGPTPVPTATSTGTPAPTGSPGRDQLGAVAPSPTGPPAPAFGLTATVLNPDQVRIDWQTDRTDITGWNVARDGHDDRGTAAWDADLATTARSHTFNLLIAGTDYTFTLTPMTTTGPGQPARVRANTAHPAGSGPGGTTTGGTTTGGTPPGGTTAGGSGDTAAQRFGWGTPLPASDEFNYVGAPDPSKWDRLGGCVPGHVGNGRRCDANSQVNGSTLVQTGTAGGDTGWLGSTLDQRYGRWEVRVRSMDTGADTGRQYHPVLIIWPDREPWPLFGEYDFLENSAPGEACAGAFIHYPHPASVPVQQEHAVDHDCATPLSQWHNVAIDWEPTGITGYIDGRPWFSFAGGGGPNGRSDIQAMPGGHLTIQFDNFFGGGLTPAQFEVDWVHIYKAA